MTVTLCMFILCTYSASFFSELPSTGVRLQITNKLLKISRLNETKGLG